MAAMWRTRFAAGDVCEVSDARAASGLRSLKCSTDDSLDTGAVIYIDLVETTELVIEMDIYVDFSNSDSFSFAMASRSEGEMLTPLASADYFYQLTDLSVRNFVHPSGSTAVPIETDYPLGQWHHVVFENSSTFAELRSVLTGTNLSTAKSDSNEISTAGARGPFNRVDIGVFQASPDNGNSVTIFIDNVRITPKSTPP